MKKVYDYYTTEELKDFVEAYYGDNIQLRVRMDLPGERIAKGMDPYYESMEFFLNKLEEKGYRILKSDHNGCYCRGSK